MAIRRLDDNLDIISALDNEPNDEGGLTSAELKAKFDEGGNTIKRYINSTLIPDLTEAVRSEVDAVSIAAGNLPIGGTTGQLLVKKSDTDYDLAFEDAAVADSVSDGIAAAYGKSGGASMNELFGDLAFAVQYEWERKRHDLYEMITDNHVQNIFHSSTSQTTTSTVYYASGMTVDPRTGAKAFTETSSVTVAYNTNSNARLLKGKYWALSPLVSAPDIYYTLPDAANNTAWLQGSNYLVAIYAAPVTITRTTYQPEYLHSADPDAYPHEADDEYDFTFFGRFSDLPVHSTKIVTGSYTGDGSAKRRLELGFTPSAVIVRRTGDISSSYLPHQNGLAVREEPYRANAAATYPAIEITDGGFNVFYNATATYGQMTNAATAVYSYVALR